MLKKIFNHTPIILLFVVILAGAFLRFSQLGESSLWIDEGYSINASTAIMEHGYPLLESGQVYTNQPLVAYAIAGSTGLFGLDPFNPWSARIPAALFGVLVILMTFIFARRIFENDWLALGCAIFIAFLPWEIAWSRQARGYTMLQFFLLVSFDQLYIFLESKKFRASFFAAAALVLAWLSHGLAVAFIPGFLFTLLVWLVTERRKVSYIALLPLSIITAGASYLGVKFVQHLEIVNYLSYYNSFVLEHYMVIFILGITGFIIMILRRNSNWAGTILLGATAMAYVIIAGYGSTVQYRYLTPLLPFISIGSMYTIYYALQTMVPRLHKNSQLIPPVASCIIFVGLLFFAQHIALTPTSTLYPDSPQSNFRDAYQYVLDNQTENDQVVSPYAHLTNIYLGDPGVLLPVSLTGRKSELQATITSNKTDYYTNTNITDDAKLFNPVNRQSGFLIIDHMARQRIPSTFNTAMSKQYFQLVYFSPSKEDGGNVWVFKY